MARKNVESTKKGGSGKKVGSGKKGESGSITGSKSSGKSIKSTKGSKKSTKKNAIEWEHDPQIKYRLSDKAFIDRGWTLLPREKIVRKITTYNALPSNPRKNLFNKLHLESPEKLFYPDGSPLAKFKKNGAGTIFYPGGRTGIVRQITPQNTWRIVVMSPGGKDPRSGRMRVPTVCAIFDSLGYGVVYDEDGKVRLVYSQKRGVLLDTINGRPVKWTWPVKLVNDDKVHSLGKEETVFNPIQESGVLKEDEVDKTMNLELTDKKSEAASEKEKQGLVTSASSAGGKRKKRGTASVKNRVVVVSSAPESLETTVSKPIRGKIKKGKGNKSPIEEIPKAVQEEIPPKIETSPVNIDVIVSQLKELKKRQINEVCAPVKPIVMNLNEFLNLRLFDQSTVNVELCAQRLIMRLELGVVVDAGVEVSVETADPKTYVAHCGVPNVFETFPTKSLTRVLERLGKQRARSAIREVERVASKGRVRNHRREMLLA